MHRSNLEARADRNERWRVSEGFMDLGFIGLPYTWDNRQQGNDNVKVRLDRGLASSAFLEMFNDVKVACSDHQIGSLLSCP